MLLKKLKLNTRNWIRGNKKEYTDNKISRKLTMCKKCYAFYYRNSWHFDKPIYLETEKDEELNVRFMQCLACLEQEAISYETGSEWVTN